MPTGIYSLLGYLPRRVMSMGQDGSLTRHDTTTPERASGSMSPTDAYHGGRPPMWCRPRDTVYPSDSGQLVRLWEWA